MNDIFFLMPVAFVAAPALFFITILIASMLFGFLGSIDLDISGDGVSDVNLNPISKVMVSSGISKVPFIIGITLTYWVALPVVYLTDSLIFEPYFSGVLHHLICIIYSVIILYFSLYVAGFLLKPVARIISLNDSFVMPSLIGLKGITNTTIDNSFGRVTVDYKDKSSMVNARVKDGASAIPSGSKVIITSLLKGESSDRDAVYLVESKE